MRQRQGKPGDRRILPADFDVSAFRGALLDWYDGHARIMSWRVPPHRSRLGERAEPYHVWLSEVMLQQTTVAAVEGYFSRFIAAFPNVAALAAADQSAVMAMWSGLGYYSRARNLHAAAKSIIARGGFPDTEEGWRALPGIGAYASASIAAIAFSRAANVVDGNVERVMARLFAVETPLPAARQALREYAAQLVRDERPGDYAQALMELGATLCRPRDPACERCPVSRFCSGLSQGAPQTLPKRVPKRPKKALNSIAWVGVAKGHVWLVKRPQNGLLGGLEGPVDSGWVEGQPDAQPPFDADWHHCGQVRHVFTHIALSVTVMQSDLTTRPRPGGGEWVGLDALGERPLSTLARKILRCAGVAA